MLYYGYLESLDGQYITPRTKASEVQVTFDKLPAEAESLILFYKDAPGNSPGVYLSVNKLTITNNVYTFLDYHKRPFKLKIEGKDSV